MQEKSYEDFLLGLVDKMSEFIFDRYDDFFEDIDEVILYFANKDLYENDINKESK